MRMRSLLRGGLILVAIATALSGVLLILVGAGILATAGAVFAESSHFTLDGVALILLAGVVAAWVVSGQAVSLRVKNVWIPRITQALSDWNNQNSGLSRWSRTVHLVLISAAGLFFELVLIRYLGAEIKVFAFLKNVVLIAAFLGLGLGFFLAPRRLGLLPLFLPAAALLLVSVALGAASGLLTFTVIPGAEDLVLLGLTIGSDAIPAVMRLVAWIPYYGITLLYFVATVLVFVPLGQYTGKCMQAFASIPAYSLNLLGALAGTLLFVAISFVWLPPIAWFGLAALMVLPIVWNSTTWLRYANLLAAAVLLISQGIPDKMTVWSPYNKLVVSPTYVTDTRGQRYDWGYLLSVGEYYYQNIADFSQAFFRAHPDAGPQFRYTEYEVPYAFANPQSVLILGAGTGNDVAAALRHGAKSVDAVDIDPGIIAFGRELHPEQPYSSPAVVAHVNDARAFLREPGPAYDLVLFGLLDSQQVLSAFGSVRLDNFVYTVEGMRAAFSRVKPDGLLVVTFELFQPWMGDRIAGILEAATGQAPVVLDAPHGTVFIIRNGEPINGSEIDAARVKLDGQASLHPIDLAHETLTTDDWPYLYLRNRGMPLAYWTMLPLLALAAWGLSRRILGKDWSLQWRFFWLGAAFMLMEVRIIAQSALLFGSTWLVSAAAITAVLLMAILANLLVAWKRVTNVRPWAILLLVSLAASSLIPSSVFLGLGQLTGGLVAALVLALPIFFAGMVFSASLSRAENVATAMASNLIGAILGGFIEYLSLILGIGSLAWLAALLYILALFAPVVTAPSSAEAGTAE